MRVLSYGRQYIDDDDIAAVVAVLKGDWLTQGPSVSAFEKAFEDYTGAKHAVSFANGTAALHGAYFAAGVEPGDEVLTTPMTFAATGNGALYLGGSVTFADIDPETLCLDPKKAEEKITPATRVIAPVSFAGYPVDLAPFKKLAEKNGAVIIEDGCHALGAMRGGVPAGREADLTVFSFHPVKHITTGEGGMVVTNSDEFARRLRLFRTHGITKDPAEMEEPPDGPWSTEMQALGFNYRLSDIHASLGLSQMKKLDSFTARRREIAALYDELLSGINGVKTPPATEGHAYHLYPLRVEAGRRAEFMTKLREKGVAGMVHYLPLHLHLYYRRNFGWKKGDFPEAEAFYSEEISLPMFYGLSDDEVRRVAGEIREIAGSRG
jgi:perosamine synthetase